VRLLDIPVALSKSMSAQGVVVDRAKAMRAVQRIEGSGKKRTNGLLRLYGYRPESRRNLQGRLFEHARINLVIQFGS
jgi:hypothetical protein